VSWRAGWLSSSPPRIVETKEKKEGFIMALPDLVQIERVLRNQLNQNLATINPGGDRAPSDETAYRSLLTKVQQAVASSASTVTWP
jgi:hypothetical protein